MLLLGICFICSVNPLVLNAFPVESQANSKDLGVLNARLTDPADYPDLTNGLTDAEVQESLKDLTLDDLNSLNKLLDERLGRDEDVDDDASLTAHGGQAMANIRKQDFQSMDVGLDDNCRDEDDSDETKPNSCTKRPTCPTTKRCSKKSTCAPKTTRMYSTKSAYDNCKPKSGGFVDDDLLSETTKSPKPKNRKCKKPKDDFECEADDFLCQASRRSRGKESRDTLLDEEYIPGQELTGNAQLGDELTSAFNDQGELLNDAQIELSNSEFDNNLGLENQAIVKQGQPFDLGRDSKINTEHKHQKNEYRRQNPLEYPENLKHEPSGQLKEEDQANLDQNYNAKIKREQSTDLELRSQSTLDQEDELNLNKEYQPNLDLTNLGNFEQEHQANFDSEYQNNFQKDHLNNWEKEHLANFDAGQSASFHQGEQQFNRNQKAPNVEGVDRAENEPIANEADPLDLYDRHQSSRTSHRKREQTEKQFVEQMHNEDDNKQASIKDEPMPLNSNLPKQEHFFDSESFIANNARDPPRYLIQMQDDYIQSENERGERRLLEDRRESEALNMDKLTEEEPRTMEEFHLDSEYRRKKRENKNTNDSPENSKETYIKMLMDSFPRDQGGRINAHAALRQSNLAHLRIKRS
ncbi:titin homolog isoform X1 [Drosophila mauritiana]|uniref:Titin homolog isoform X1 n=1 Tax=Drosophila mauritiana TaxID=7226 RepID=A0A6P8JT68_DROMA|nr:titin homolog isoform X1 [Drosophila mauritiana]